MALSVSLALGWALSQMSFEHASTEDQPVKIVEIYKLTDKQAKQVSTILPPSHPDLSVTHEPFSNSLVVTGTKEKIQRFERRLAQIPKN